MKKEILIKILNNPHSYEEEHAEAIEKLALFPDKQSLDLLTKIASSKNNTQYLREKAGAAIAYIMIERNILDAETIKTLSADAQSEIESIFENDKREWFLELINSK